MPGAGSRSLLEASAAYPCSVRLPSALDATIARYRHLEIEYAALRVVGRGLFLAVMLMLAFLYVFTRITDILTGVNEVLVPTLTVAPDVDLGALAQGAFSRTSASVIGALSALTLAASALLSGKALLDGTQRALLGEAAGRTSLLGARTILVAIILSVTIFLSWLVTLATSIRQRAWVQLLGRDISTLSVNVGKAALIAFGVLLVGGCTVLAIRRTLGTLSYRAFATGIVVGVVVVAANFFLLYSFVGALINPAVSAEVVLILSLLLWVNIVVRVYLGALTWLGAREPFAHGSGVGCRDVSEWSDMADSRASVQYAIYFHQQWVGDHSEEWFRSRGPLARAVVAEMREAGVLVFAGGLEEEIEHSSTADPTGGTVTFTNGPYGDGTEFLGGITVVSVTDEAAALMWAARIAEACGWPQQVRLFK